MKRNFYRLIVGVAVFLLLGGCSDPAESARWPLVTNTSTPWFDEQAAERGITFRHLSGASGDYFLPEITGGGVALIDIEGDGDQDLYFIQSGYLEPDRNLGVHNELFVNDGTGHFTALEGTENALFDTGYGMGATVGDYDNDGYLDIYLTNLGPNRMLRNNGRGEFIDVTNKAGLEDESWGTAAVFLDIDQDYDLDLFVVNYLHWSPATSQDCFTLEIQTYCLPSHDNAASDRLFLNQGNGTFTDITSQAGFDAAFGNGLGVVTADFNADGLIDIFVANDGMVNQLWLNNGDLTFTDSAHDWSCAMDDHGITKAGMGVATADPDFDGDFDIIVVNIQSQTDSVFRNDGEYFSDVTSTVGLGALSRRYTRFGVVLRDLNNDGLLDLYEANGKVYHGHEDTGPDVFAEPNSLFEGTDSFTFQVSSAITAQDNDLTHTSRGVASGDLNNDGHLDLVVVNRDAAPYLLMNQGTTGHNWIRFQLIDKNDRNSLGSQLQGFVGSRRVTTLVQTAGSYLASNEPIIHIGLGEATQLQNVQVTWVTGTSESFGSFLAGDTHVLHEGRGYSTTGVTTD